MRHLIAPIVIAIVGILGTLLIASIANNIVSIECNYGKLFDPNICKVDE